METCLNHNHATDRWRQDSNTIRQHNASTGGPIICFPKHAEAVIGRSMALPHPFFAASGYSLREESGYSGKFRENAGGDTGGLLGSDLGHHRDVVEDELRSDPAGFVAELPEWVVIDEIQRAPELFLAIKVAADRRRTPGRFLLTGSTNILLLPTLADSLAGRMGTVYSRCRYASCGRSRRLQRLQEIRSRPLG